MEIFHGNFQEEVDFKIFFQMEKRGVVFPEKKKFFLKTENGKAPYSSIETRLQRSIVWLLVVWRSSGAWGSETTQKQTCEKYDRNHLF